MNWYFIAFEVFGFIFTLFGIYHFFIVFKNRNYDRYSRAIMIMILGILQQLKIEVPKEYRKKICEVLTTQERKAAQEGKVWYQEQLKKWKGDSGGI